MSRPAPGTPTQLHFVEVRLSIEFPDPDDPERRSTVVVGPGRLRQTNAQVAYR